MKPIVSTDFGRYENKHMNTKYDKAIDFSIIIPSLGKFDTKLLLCGCSNFS